MIIEKEKSCSFSGHRILPKNFNVAELKKAVDNAINDGFSYFLVGMAIGFDTICFKELLDFREKKDIKIIACVPCRDQSEKFNRAQKKEYFELLKNADDIIYLADSYYEGCMQKRNEFMVDNSSRLICALFSTHGGTYSTVKYAAEKGLQIVYLNK